jgi:phage terminase large subunit-like protein
MGGAFYTLRCGSAADLDLNARPTLLPDFNARLTAATGALLDDHLIAVSAAYSGTRLTHAVLDARRANASLIAYLNGACWKRKHRRTCQRRRQNQIPHFKKLLSLPPK